MRSIPVGLAVFALAFSVAAAPAAEQRPGPAATSPAALGTGFDLAVVDIETLGPNVPCVYCPVIEVKNLGLRAVHGTFQYTYLCNGVVVFPSRDVVLNLAPGGVQKIAPHMPLDQNFARYGDTVRATIDVDNRLKEDNELNNHYQEKLAHPLLRQPARSQ